MIDVIRFSRFLNPANPKAARSVLPGVMILTNGPLHAAALRCPPRLPGPHPGFEQVGPIPTAHWLLWKMQLFDAPPGEAAPADLTPGLTVEPDNAFTLNWHLQGDENPLMPCRYDGSATYYRAYPRPSPTSYTLRNDNGLTRAWCEAP